MPSFIVIGSEREVEAWSEQRLPFEPTGELRQFRDAVRRQARALSTGSGEILHAVYQSASADLVDAENVLLYNVGPGDFAAVGHHGIRFERSFDHPSPPPQPVGWQPNHYHHYSQARDGDGFTHWTRGRTLARWERADCGPMAPYPKIALVWLGIRRAAKPAIPLPDRAPVRFGLSINVEHGAGRPGFRLVDAIKAIFDGAVAAFHQHRSGPRDATGEITDRLAVATGVSRPDVAELLDRSDVAILGSRRLVFCRGAGLQWNPGDDGCVAGEILRLPVPGLDRITLSGELFEVRPAAS